MDNHRNRFAIVGGFILSLTAACAPEPATAQNGGASATDALVLVTREKAGGLTNEDVTLDIAEAIGEHRLERTRARTIEASKRLGQTFNPNDITQTTSVIEHNDRKYIVTRLSGYGVNYANFYTLIEDGQAVQVSCQSQVEGKEVAIAGACSQRLANEIGLDMIENAMGRAR